MSGSITLFRVRGIPIRVHWSLLLALLYIAYAFSQNFERMAQIAGVPVRHLSLPNLLWGGLVAIGLFVSVTLHELAHSLFARRVGGRVREITLMIVGGVSRMDKMPPSLTLEGWMAFVGPLSSLAIAGALWLARMLVPTGGALADLRLGLFYLASLNLTLAIFNLLPAFPMDGGRVFRALLGRRLGRARATRIAAAVGKGMAPLFFVVGILGRNVLLIIIGLFLFGGATAEARAQQLHLLLENLKIRDIMTRRPLTARLDEPLVQIGNEMRETGRQEAVVLDDRDQSLGILVEQDLSRADRADARARDLVQLFAGRAVEVGPDEDAESYLTRGAEQGAAYALVVDPTASPALVGLVGPSEIQAALALRGLTAKRGAPGPAQERRS